MNRLFLTYLCCIISPGLFAQKLPNVQTESQLLPTTFNIDGKLNEWQNRLKANNNATSIEYVLADDADNLYLATRATDLATINKILVGGIKFGINTAGKKAVIGPSITFPFTTSAWDGTKANFKILTDTPLIIAAIKQLKFIKTNNVIGLQDSVLAIYNDVGILTSMRYHNNALIYEMLVPKKLLGLVGASKAFAYQVTLNGYKQSDKSGSSSLPTIPPAGRSASHPIYILTQLGVTTDFWGEYTLAKQP
ncbi:hypothetical protein GCM10027049_13290 [Mucilaginibacter puniceus]